MQYEGVMKAGTNSQKDVWLSMVEYQPLTLFIAVTKCPTRNISREEKFILAHILRSFTQLRWQCRVSRWLHVGGNKRLLLAHTSAERTESKLKFKA